MGLLDKIAQLQQDGLFGERAAMRDTLRRQQALSRQDQLREQAALLKPTLSRFGAETAQQVGSLLLSDSPNARAMGAEQLAGLMESAGNVSPAMQRAIQMAQAQQQGQVLQNTATAQRIQQQAEMHPLEVEALQYQRARDEATREAEILRKQSLIAGQINETEFRLSGAYAKQMESTIQVADSIQQIQASMDTGNSLGVMAGVVKLAKILDPTSVVQRSEVERTVGGIGIADQLMTAYNKLSGEGFNPGARKAFDATVRAVASPVLERGLRIEEEFRTAAKAAGVRPSSVVIGTGFNRDFVSQWLAGAPSPGAPTDFNFGGP
mgnify:FL=1